LEPPNGFAALISGLTSACDTRRRSENTASVRKISANPDFYGYSARFRYCAFGAKDSPYECGFGAFEDSRMKFDVRYYLVAILFIIFDLEIAFLFPWAVALDAIGLSGLVAMGIFLSILIIGFIYEWKKGALEWE
jgi:NADH-quinone oxidoreductase subunit A